MNIILASKSPRRKALLNVLGLDFTVKTSSCDEFFDYMLPVEDIVKSLSFQKADDVAKTCGKDDIIIGADTVVVYQNNILGKPKDFDDAKRMLHLLSGKTHQVYTGITIIRNSDRKIVTDYEKTDVTFRKITSQEIENYVNSGDPMDKAGAYSIQGTASSFVLNLEGDYNNVVGLPIYMLSKYLYNEFGVKS